MIHVQVRFFNMLAVYAGIRCQVVELPPGSSASVLFDHLVQNRTPAFRDMLFSTGKINPHLRIFLNDTLLDPANVEVELSDGDEILMFPAISGGSDFVPRNAS